MVPVLLHKFHRLFLEVASLLVDLLEVTLQHQSPKHLHQFFVQAWQTEGSLLLPLQLQHSRLLLLF